MAGRKDLGTELDSHDGGNSTFKMSNLSHLKRYHHGAYIPGLI